MLASVGNLVDDLLLLQHLSHLPAPRARHQDATIPTPPEEREDGQSK